MRRPGSALQRMELLYGIAACVLGIAALVYILFGPLYRGSSSSSMTICDSPGHCTSTIGPEVHSTSTLLQMGIQPETIVFLTILLLLYLAIALSAALHSSWGQSNWLVMLCAAAGLTLLLTALGMLSIGIFLLPGTLLGVVAAGLGVRMQVVERG